MTMKNKKFSGGYYRNTFEMAGESEGSGSSGRIDMEIAASDDSSVPTRKCINLNNDKQETLGAPFQVIYLSNLSSSKRKKLKSRLRSELEQIRILQKRFGFQRINGATVSSSSDILSCSNGQNGPQAENFWKSSVVTSTNGRQVNNKPAKGQNSNRNATGRFESTKLAPSSSTTNSILMKQCETLLKRLMAHQYGFIFNTPVDAVKLKIPDYHTIITNPMDLGTIKNKITSGQYSTPLEFLSDVRLTFSNAMTYNPAGNDVHVMAVSLSNYFEVRWKTIEKKLPASEQVAVKLSAPEDLETAKSTPSSKKRKISSIHHEIIPEPVKKVMTEEEKNSLGRELESLLGEMPIHIVDFLRERSSNGKESGEDEIEIDMDDLSDDTLLSLRKLLDDHFHEKQQNQARAVPCEIELLNESGLSNSSMQHCKGNDPEDEEVDIGGNEPPVSSYPTVEIEKDACCRRNKCVSSGSSSDSGSSSESEYENARDLSQVDQPEVPGGLGYGAELDEKTNGGDNIDRDQSLSGLDQLEQSSQQKPSSVDSDCRQDGDSVPIERQISPERLYRAALLKNRFADTILKAREKTLAQGDKGDPEKLRREREKIELQRRKEKARLQAEAKAAEDARRRAEAEAVAEAKRQRELKREAARQALRQMEKTVEINENCNSIEDLELLRAAPADHLPSSVDETSPEHSHDGLGAFKFGGSNPLEQLGLFMKADEEEEEEEEGEPPHVPNPVNDVEEGEID
ncbi:transcription factor GTE8-like isoform X2 [Tripterygium wilfordii]|uniref:transcription factor GTE8-like isoform X2 n=1 Tax=Tripterygium wilfordii TaxID=458696 RepID=UPI0018F8229E|nr:transcription factor GTE8-like isoform X2 [Tripterygium wilfordii]